MSVDHSAAVRCGDAKFLHVRPGHFVIVGGKETAKGDWWMGQVVFCEGGARDPKVNSLFRWPMWIQVSSAGSMPTR